MMLRAALEVYLSEESAKCIIRISYGLARQECGPEIGRFGKNAWTNKRCCVVSSMDSGRTAKGVVRGPQKWLRLVSWRKVEVKMRVLHCARWVFLLIIANHFMMRGASAQLMGST